MVPGPPDDDLFRALHAVRGQPLEPGEVGLRALLAQARQQGLRWHAAYAQAVLSHRLQLRAPQESQALAEAALAEFEALSCDWGRCTALDALGGVAVAQGQTRLGLQWNQAALRLAEQIGDPELRVRSISNTAIVLSKVDQDQTAVDLLEEGLRHCRPEWDRLRQVMVKCSALARVRLARLARNRGEPPAQWQPLVRRAVELLESGFQEPLPAPDLPSQTAYGWGALAAALVLLDEHARGRAILQRLEPLYASRGDDHALAFVHGQWAWSHLQCGDADAALASAALLRRHAQATGGTLYDAACHEIEAAALEAAGRWQEALAAYKGFHQAFARHVHTQAEEHARSLAVTLQTERALREAQQDPLTRLANRRGFDAALAEAAGGTAPRSLMLIDLDHFKGLNDTHGHAAGDAALQGLAEVMRQQCRDRDLPARLGGDEFALLVAGPPDAAVRLAGRIRTAFGQWRPAAAELAAMPAPTLSIGIAGLEPGSDTRAWLAAADRALYAAKAAGRDTMRCHGSAPPDASTP